MKSIRCALALLLVQSSTARAEEIAAPVAPTTPEAPLASAPVATAPDTATPDTSAQPVTSAPAPVPPAPDADIPEKPVREPKLYRNVHSMQQAANDAFKDCKAGGGGKAQCKAARAEVLVNGFEDNWGKKGFNAVHAAHLAAKALHSTCKKGSTSELCEGAIGKNRIERKLIERVTFGEGRDRKDLGRAVREVRKATRGCLKASRKTQAGMNRSDCFSTARASYALVRKPQQTLPAPAPAPDQPGIPAGEVPQNGSLPNTLPGSNSPSVVAPVADPLPVSQADDTSGGMSAQ